MKNLLVLSVMVGFYNQYFLLQGMSDFILFALGILMMLGVAGFADKKIERWLQK